LKGFACPAITSFLARGNDIYNYNFSFANLTAQCIATISAVEQVVATFSEDCLTLNVWAPSGGETNKAVMIWIYGSGYITGSTQISLYDGQHLAANQDVSVVSIKCVLLPFHHSFFF
jgi:cholinesterase